MHGRSGGQPDRTPAHARRRLARPCAASGLLLALAAIVPAAAAGEALAERADAREFVLGLPIGIAVDVRGNCYVADRERHVVRCVDLAGRSRIVAGRGEPGAGGDGGRADAAHLSHPTAIVLAGDGGLFISDSGNHRVRRVGPDGVISTVAGDGACGFLGDGGPATAARLDAPWGLALGPAGELYIADSGNDRIRRVSPDGTIATVAGGDAPSAVPLKAPRGIAAAADGSLCVADSGNHRVLRIDRTGGIGVLAGSGAPGFAGDGAAATAAQLREPSGVAIGRRGEICIADTGNHRIRRIGVDGIIATVAGTGASGVSGDGGIALHARLASPSGVAVDATGALHIADSASGRVRRVGADGGIATTIGRAWRARDAAGADVVARRPDDGRGVVAHAIVAREVRAAAPRRGTLVSASVPYGIR